MKLLFKSLVVLLILPILFWAIRLNVWSYNEFIDWAIKTLSRPDLESVVRNAIRPSNFQLIQFSAIAIVVLYGLIAIFCIKKTEEIVDLLQWYVRQINTSISSIIKIIKDQPRLNLVAFLIITLLFIIKSYWYVFTWPMEYDEAWTYNHYISKPWIVLFTAAHNNHVLYTIFAKLSSQLFFFLRPIEAIRVPLPFFALVTALILFKYIAERWTKNAALLGYAVFLSSMGVVFYALYARAYMVGICFNMLFLYAFAQFIETRKKYYQITFVVAVILSVYAIPTSIYFLIPVVIVFSVNALMIDSTIFRPLLLSGLLAVIGILGFYAPFIISTKMSWLLGGLESSNFDLGGVLKRFYRQNGVKLTSLGELKDFGFGFVWFIALFAMFFAKKHKKEFVLVVISLLAPLGFMLFHQKFIFTRVFTYNALFYAILMGVVITWVFQKSRIEKVLPIVAVFWFLFFSYRVHSHKTFRWSNHWDNATVQMFSALQQAGATEVYNYFYYAKPALEYFSLEKDYSLEVIMSQTKSISYQEFDKQPWQAVIWWNDCKAEKPDLSSYKLIWENKPEGLSLYQRVD